MLFGLRPNYGGGSEDDGDLLQKARCTRCCSQCHRPCRPPLTHASTGHSWTLTASLGQSLWDHRSFLLGSGAHKVVCLFVPSRSLFPPSCVSSGGSMVGLMGPPPRGLMQYPGLLHPTSLPLWQTTADPEETLQHSSGSVSVGSLGPCVH